MVPITAEYLRVDKVFQCFDCFANNWLIDLEVVKLPLELTERSSDCETRTYYAKTFESFIKIWLNRIHIRSIAIYYINGNFENLTFKEQNMYHFTILN